MTPGIRTALLWPLFTAQPALVHASTQDIQINGRVGFRVEYMANENFAENDATREDDHRLRFRARARIAGRYSPSDVVTVGFRLSTGSENFPSSGWSTLSDDFRRDAIALDRAYVHLRPSAQFELRFGFDENPLFRPTELVWDGDVSPGGIAEVLQVGSLRLVAGQFMLREVRSLKAANEENAFLFAHGIGYARSGATDVEVTLYNYIYHNPDAVATAIDGGELDGEYKTNRFDPANPAAYFSDYVLIGAAARLTRNRMTITAEAAVNLGAEQDATLGTAFVDRENLAAGGMIVYAYPRERWGWSLGAGFFHIEADAVLAPYNSDDLQQTNVNVVPLMFQLDVPGGAQLVWDTYIQRKIDVNLASNGGLVHDENATKVRTRVTIQARF